MRQVRNLSYEERRFCVISTRLQPFEAESFSYTSINEFSGNVAKLKVGTGARNEGWSQLEYMIPRIFHCFGLYICN